MVVCLWRLFRVSDSNNYTHMHYVYLNIYGLFLMENMFNGHFTLLLGEKQKEGCV